MLGQAVEQIRRFGYYTAPKKLLIEGMTKYRLIFLPILTVLRESDKRLRRNDLEIGC